MTMITGGSTIAVTRSHYGAMDTRHYKDWRDMMLGELTSNGEEGFQAVRDILLPRAEAVWYKREIESNQEEAEDDEDCRRC